MSTVLAEALAGQALRDYLLRTLPAKVFNINSNRAAVLKTPYAGPYVVAGNLRLGQDVGSETVATLTTGVRTAAQVVSDLNTSQLAGMLASADAQGRIVLTGISTNGGGRSVISLAASAAGVNAAFGWSDGGQVAVAHGLVAPTYNDVFDGAPDVQVVGQAPMQIFIGDRTTQPRSANIRDDCNLVDLQVDVCVTDPNESIATGRDYIQAAVRAVREVILDDRTLDGAVHLTQLPSNTFQMQAFQFVGADGAYSALMMRSRLVVRCTIFERTP